MAVGTEDHFPASGKVFTHILMNDRHVRGNENAPVFSGCGKSENMIIFVDRTSDSTKRIMTAGQYVRDREFRHAGSACCLNNSDVGNVMTGHGIKALLQILHILCCIMSFQNAVSNRTLVSFLLVKLAAGFFRLLLGDNFITASQVNAAFV